MIIKMRFKSHHFYKGDKMLMTIKYLDSECQYCNIHTLILKDSDNNVIGSFEGGNITLSNIGEVKELSKGHYEVAIEG